MYLEVLDSKLAKYITSKFGPFYTGVVDAPWLTQTRMTHESAIATGKASWHKVGHTNLVGLPGSQPSQSWDLTVKEIPHLSLWSQQLARTSPWLPEDGGFTVVPFLKCLWQNSFSTRSAFGSPLPFQQVIALIENIPAQVEAPPSTHLDYPIESGIILGDSNLAVPTVSGWRFQAGSTYRANLSLWKKVSTCNQLITSILTKGWQAPTFCLLKPAWFDSIPLSPPEQLAWDKEVVSLWQMGAVRPIDWAWASKHGLPLVVIPVFFGQ